MLPSFLCAQDFVGIGSDIPEVCEFPGFRIESARGYGPTLPRRSTRTVCFGENAVLGADFIREVGILVFRNLLCLRIPFSNFIGALLANQTEPSGAGYAEWTAAVPMLGTGKSSILAVFGSSLVILFAIPKLGDPEVAVLVRGRAERHAAGAGHVICDEAMSWFRL